MANVRVRLRLKGLNQLMSSDPVQKVVDERARRIAQAAGANFEAVAIPHKKGWTARAFIQPANGDGVREEAEDKRLSGALNAGS